MAIIEITGGTAEFHDRVSKEDRDRIKYAFANLRVVMREKYEGSIPFDDLKAGDTSTYRQDGEFLQAMDTFTRIVLPILVVGWTRPEPLPTTLAEWLRIEPEDAPEILDEMANKAFPLALAAMSAGSVVVSPETVKDPNSPTVPSSDSNGGGLAVKTHSTTRRSG